MRLRGERDPFNTVYSVFTDEGRNLGTVTKETSSRARRVRSTGGVTRWVARTPSGEVVSASNTYRRVDAIEALENHWRKSGADQ